MGMRVTSQDTLIERAQLVERASALLAVEHEVENFFSELTNNEQENENIYE